MISIRGKTPEDTIRMWSDHAVMWRDLADQSMKEYDRRIKNWNDALCEIERLEQQKIMEEEWTGE